MSRVGGGAGVPPKPTTAAASSTGETAAQAGSHAAAQAKSAAGKGSVDQFQRTGTAVQAKLQALSGQALATKLNFSNHELALMARTFHTIVRNHPSADRLKRAKLFAQAILGRKGLLGKSKFSRLLDLDDEELDEKDRRHLEELYDLLAEQLDSTPVFAQIVDDVTESVRKIG